jgi:4-hydroxy-3-methylbut-2-enyl diphosphate reductase
MLKLVEEDLSLMLVIGGFNSSNTTHLQEIAIERGIPSYHIDSAERIIDRDRIEHKPLGKEIEIANNWLPDGQITVGVTSGASTPDKVVAEVIAKIFAFKENKAVNT